MADALPSTILYLHSLRSHFSPNLINMPLLLFVRHCPRLPVAGLIITFWGASIVVVPVMPLIVNYLGAAKAEVWQI